MSLEVQSTSVISVQETSEILREVPRHIRFAELRKNKSNNHISQMTL